MSKPNSVDPYDKLLFLTLLVSLIGSGLFLIGLAIVQGL